MTFNYWIVAQRKDPRGKGLMTLPIKGNDGETLIWSWDDAVAETTRLNKFDNEGGAVHYQIMKIANQPE